MKSRTSFGLLSAAFLLAPALALAILGAGCKSGGEDSASSSAPGASNSAGGPGNMPGGPGNMPGGPGNMSGGPGNMPAGPGGPGNMPGGPGGPGNMPAGPGGPGGPGGMSGPGGPGGPGGGSASAGPSTSPEDVKIAFRQMKMSGLRPMKIKQPNGRTISGFQFHYQPRGDVEGLLPLLNPGSSSSAGVWMVQMPKVAAVGQKTRGEWENLFCTYVVPDQTAVNRAQQSLIARLDQVRSKVYGYGKKAYKIDVEAGDKVPASAKAQANDVVVTSMPDRLQRAAYYAALAGQAIKDRRPDQAKLFQSAAMESLGDLAWENGRSADALWIYQQAPKVAQ